MANGNLGNFVKGAAIGMAVGAAAALGTKMALSNGSGISKGSAKVIKAVGDFADGVQTMFK